MALQLIAIKGPSFRKLRRWIASAAISFPVPLSPSSRTGALAVATLRIAANTSCICELVPRMPSNASALSFVACRDIPFQGLRHRSIAGEEVSVPQYQSACIRNHRPRTNCLQGVLLSSCPEMMMTFAVLSKASKPDKAAKPSSGSFGRGGRPKSRIVTAGRCELNVSRAPARSQPSRHHSPGR